MRQIDHFIAGGAAGGSARSHAIFDPNQGTVQAQVALGGLKALGQARGTTTVMVTHDNRILDRADRILTLCDGVFVGNG